MLFNVFSKLIHQDIFVISEMEGNQIDQDQESKECVNFFLPAELFNLNLRCDPYHDGTLHHCY